jgi:hypothetical protein
MLLSYRRKPNLKFHRKLSKLGALEVEMASAKLSLALAFHSCLIAIFLLAFLHNAC